MEKILAIEFDFDSGNGLVFDTREDNCGTMLLEQIRQYDNGAELPKIEVKFYTPEQMAEAERIGREMS